MGVVAMFGSLLILLLMPIVDISRQRGAQFRPMMKFAFWLFVVNFFILFWIGAKHPAGPYVLVGQLATAFYFAWFLILVPLIGLIENTLMDLATESNNKKNESPFYIMSQNPFHPNQGLWQRKLHTTTKSITKI